MLKINNTRTGKIVIENFQGYLFILPALIILGVFFIYPAIELFGLAYTDYSLMSGKGSFIGLANFKALLDNGDFLNSLLVTFKLALFIVPVQTIIAMVMAVFVNQKLMGMKIFRTIYFIPAITSFVAVAIMWKQIYNPTFGLANSVLGLLNLGPFQFLSSKSQALISVAITCIWKSWGYFMVIFISGLQDIPAEIQEASYIDGANQMKRFFYITVPMLRKVTLFVMIITTMDAIKLFIPSFTMTAGGPLGSTDTAVHYIWRQAFRLQQVGPATAMSTVLFLIIIIITVLQLKVDGRNDEGGR